MDQNGTKARIVEAAIEVFLEKGYDAATIRGICSRAGANVAAVNYHFGSKDALRAAALERIMASTLERYPMEEGLAEASCPRQRLKCFVGNLLRLVHPQDPEYARRAKLVWQEIDKPSPVFQPLVERFWRPIKEMLDAITREYLGKAGPETMRLCAGSIVGQCTFYAQNKLMIHHLFQGEASSCQDMDSLAEHIVLFSQSGLKALCNQHSINISR